MSRNQTATDVTESFFMLLDIKT